MWTHKQKQMAHWLGQTPQKSKPKVWRQRDKVWRKYVAGPKVLDPEHTDLSHSQLNRQVDWMSSGCQPALSLAAPGLA